ncbi:Muscle M-line assembly protein unc-89 [Labeo rohita]|uniref:Muscle M-line assembly protein unc-89 n=2 Tax=Labeo rohita TaxID=84645 RepID=A0ABQ8LJD3_LABRO|nr:Muscle M-line assembly protein unc-89 [Labeo rohita]
MEGDSVILNTGVIINNQERVKWYFNDSRIAQITGDLKMCTDAQCHEGTERFRDRLKLDQQTGSLTIINTITTDSGLYQVELFRNSRISENIFIVTVHGVSVSELDEMKRKSVQKGESVTLYPGEIKNKNYVMMWYFNGICIAEITEDQRRVCTDEQCKHKLKDRLRVDLQTESLIIMNTTDTDSGLYQLQISSRSFRVIRSFIVTVTVSGYVCKPGSLRREGIL